MNKVIELLKSPSLHIPRELLYNYKKMNITDGELVIIIYLMNLLTNSYNPKQISNDLNIKINEVLELINSLSEKGILKIEIKKVNNVRNEVINLDPLYEKIAFSLEDNNKENSSNIYSLFESEFGRTLSPMEYQIISGWLENGYSEELIKLALKEAAYNNVSSLRYIDTIIFEWGKKGIKTKEDVEKDRIKFKKNNTQKKELFDYDWLNDSGDN